MDMEIIDTVTADCLEIGDIIGFEGSLYTVQAFEDRGETIAVGIREVGYDDTERVVLDPNSRIELYGYSVVEV